MGLPLELLIVLVAIPLCCWCGRCKDGFRFRMPLFLSESALSVSLQRHISIATVVRFMRVNWKTQDRFLMRSSAVRVTRANLRKSSPAIFVR